MVDDGSCQLGGCTDSFAPNFNPRASYDDGTCPVVFPGCTDSTAANYRALATRESGGCDYIGCTWPLGLNYDPSATLPGKCVKPVLGCM